MHNTKVVMKDGRVFEGVIANTSLRQGWLALSLNVERDDYPDIYLGQLPRDIPEHGKLHFKDMISAVTENERVGSNSPPRDVDEIDSYRELWAAGRRFKWIDENGQPHPDEPCPF